MSSFFLYFVFVFLVFGYASISIMWNRTQI
jgi:hypothetical protein